jgi:hypothetical protein
VISHPSWSKELMTKFPTFNARAADIATKATWKGLLESQQSLVSASGCYEWKTDAETGRRRRSMSTRRLQRVPLRGRPRRGDLEADERARLAAELNAIQSRLSYYRTWTQFESPAVGDAYANPPAHANRCWGRHA